MVSTSAIIMAHQQKQPFRALLRCMRMRRLLLLCFLVCGCLVVLYTNSEISLQPLFKMFLPRSDVPAPLHAQSGVQPVSKCNNHTRTAHSSVDGGRQLQNATLPSAHSKYNIFVIYTKENYQLHIKFELFARSLLKYATIPLHLHLISDELSQASAEATLEQQMRHFRRTSSDTRYTLYDINQIKASERVQAIVRTMRPYFSSAPHTYYSDTLFFLSLGLHCIADEHLELAILLDVDIVFRADIRLLFGEFAKFSAEHLFGLAPELTPVYRHILYRYRGTHPHTSFGSPYYYPASRLGKLHGSKRDQHVATGGGSSSHGYPGLNSGVVLLHLQRIRASALYAAQLLEAQVQQLTDKYSFKGHLGDQDFYTLLGFEHPHLIYRMDCVWNRQLCTWWKDNGYSDVFDAYFHCEGKIQMYHGNCNTRVPE